MTYRAGDFISGGLSWTRPVYLGGIQAQRNFALRSDLVTLPLPSFGGTAAVPSTLEVYTQNVRTYTGNIPAGPYPDHQSAGVCRCRRSAGRAERQPRSRDDDQLAILYVQRHAGSGTCSISRQRSDFHGAISASNPTTMTAACLGVATARYGLTNWLTLEGHAEGGAEFDQWRGRRRLSARTLMVLHRSRLPAAIMTGAPARL